MDLLKAEIERKRKALQDKSLIGPDKKYFKRVDLKRKEDEEYWKKQHEKHGTSSNSAQSSISLETTKDAQNSYNATINKMKSDEKLADMIQLPRKDVVRRLRDRNEPITLFGESEAEAFLRLRKLEISEPDINKGLRNDFQEAMDQVDHNYLQELLKNNAKPGDQSSSSGNTSADVALDEQNVMDMEEIKTLTTSLGRKRDQSAQDSQTILRYLKYLLHLWGKELNDRPREVKLATAGKIAAATYTQTQYYFRPLFRQLRSNKVAEDILQHLIRIVKHMVERDYRSASSAYLEMAIGNSPWPIGVTMVGIHARTGREKISSSNIAHVLNDETQRKYIQALKRLMTFCQRRFPTDPSRSIEYNA